MLFDVRLGTISLFAATGSGEHETRTFLDCNSPQPSVSPVVRCTVVSVSSNNNEIALGTILGEKNNLRTSNITVDAFGIRHSFGRADSGDLNV